ncbi:MAG: hypothetical protein HDT39_15475 [Lachnospiraceae bacterium]|nr:hypothetical protein [Lachnospiraceae bacterium]
MSTFEGIYLMLTFGTFIIVLRIQLVGFAYIDRNNKLFYCLRCISLRQLILFSA